MPKQLIAYEGQEYTLEWYCNDKADSAALEYYKELDVARQKKIFYLFRLMGDAGEIRNEEKFINEGDQIYAFKTNPDRFFCFFFEGSKIIITNAYEKKSQKMPVREKEKALKAKADYQNRCKKGTYYE